MIAVYTIETEVSCSEVGFVANLLRKVDDFLAERLGSAQVALRRSNKRYRTRLARSCRLCNLFAVRTVWYPSLTRFVGCTQKGIMMEKWTPLRSGPLQPISNAGQPSAIAPPTHYSRCVIRPLISLGCRSEMGGPGTKPESRSSWEKRKMIKMIKRIKRKLQRLRTRSRGRRRAPIFDTSVFEDDLALLPIYVDERRSR
jgi:hypothetical protein